MEITGKEPINKLFAKGEQSPGSKEIHHTPDPDNRCSSTLQKPREAKSTKHSGPIVKCIHTAKGIKPRGIYLI